MLCLDLILSLVCDAKIIVKRLYEKELSDRSDADSAVCAVICELFECRDQGSERNFTLSDINDMLFQLAVTRSETCVLLSAKSIAFFVAPYV